MMTRAVGLFFRDDGEDVDDAGARSLLAALHDAHVAFTLECAAVLEMNKFGTCFADALRAASRGMTQAVCNAMSSASAEAGDGRSAATKRAVGEIWASTEAFKALPKSASAAVARELMRMATFVKDVSSELEELEELGGADDVGLDEDDLRFCDDDFDASELAIGKSIGTFAKACLVLLKALIVPMVKEKTTDLKALEPCVEACGRFRQSVEDLGAGVYPPQDTDELKESLAQAVKSAREMYACVREAGAGDDETKDALDVFVAASEIAEKALE